MMRYIKGFILTILVIFVFTSGGWAATYYVDATGGNDSWDGLAPEFVEGTNGPWKTIAKVNSYTFDPGDTIRLKRGETWHEGFGAITPGSAGNPVTITSYGNGDKPTIHGGNLLSSWVGPNENGVYTHTGLTSCLWLFEDNYAQAKATTNACSDGVWYWDSNDKILYYKPTSGNPDNHIVHRLARFGYAIYYEPATNIILDGIRFVGGGIYKGSTNLEVNNFTVQNCEFTNCYGGISISIRNYTSYYHNIIIKNNTFEYCATNLYFIDESVGSYGFKDIYVGHNVIRHSNGLKAGVRWEGGDADGLSFQGLRDSVIEYNDISGHADQGGGINHWIASHHTSTNMVYRYNYIHDIGGTGIVHGAGDGAMTNAKIYGNVISNFGTSDVYSPYGGIRLNSTQTSDPYTEVYNNTIYDGDIGIYLNSLVSNVTIKNNIVHTMRDYLAAINPSSSGGNNIFDYNCYYPDSDTSFKHAYNDYNFANWKTATGQDANSIIDDPGFIDVSVDDFRLNAGSPAIKAGTTGGPEKDYQGNRFRATTPSMGAIEFSIYGGVISPRTVGGSHYKPR